jgi:Na+-transporting NADH:ubiquinone oxidoreductase subunit F
MVYLWSVLSFAGLTVSLAALLLVAQRFLVSYGICKLDINTGEKPLEVEGGQTLLAALYANEIFIPSACGGKGTCGYCKITVTSGGGPVLPTETPYLTRREIRSNLRLACQVKIREDIFVRIPQQFLNIRMYTSTVESITDLTGDIRQLRLRLDEPAKISHRPGQYVQVEAPSVDGLVYRAYSISSPDYEPNVVELVVKLVVGGIASSYLHSLKVADTVRFTGPYGEFNLSDDPSVEIVCVAGGCGIAPIKSIVYSLNRRWPGRQCWLFSGCRHTKDVFYLEQFEELAQKYPGFHVVYALSGKLSGAEKWHGEKGFIHLAVDKYLEPNMKRQVYLCGPPAMVKAVTRVLLGKGVRAEDIFYDQF